MTNPRPGPADQHYLPRFYLKGFAAPNTRRQKLYVLDLSDGSIALRTTKEVGFERQLYTLEGADDPYLAEHALQHFENEAAPVIHRLWATSSVADLSDEDRQLVALFAASLFVRSPAFKQAHADVLRGGLAKRTAADAAPNAPLAALLVELNRQGFYIDFLRTAVPDIARSLLENASWLLCSPEAGQAFAVSDVPLVRTQGVPNPPEAFLAVGPQWWLPLAPGVCLLIHAPPTTVPPHRRGGSLVLPAGVVGYLNRCQYEGARAHLFAHDEALLRAIAAVVPVGYRSLFSHIVADAVAKVPLHRTDTLDQAIDRYIAPNPDGLADRARLVGSGVSVWAIIAYLQGVGGDIDQAAANYEVPREAVEAAVRYYQQHRSVIDARITLNAAAFAAGQPGGA